MKFKSLKLTELSFKEIIHTEMYLLRIKWDINPLVILLNIAVRVISSVNTLFSAYLWKLIIDELTLSYNNMSVSINLKFYLKIFFLITIIIPIIHTFNNIYQEKLNHRLKYNLNISLMEKIASLDQSYFDDPKNRNLLEKAKIYQNTVQSSSIEGLNLIINFISLIATLIMFIPYNPIFGTLYMLTFIPGSLATYKSSKSMERYSINSIPETRVKDYYHSILTGSLFAKDLRLYNLAEYMKLKFNKLWNIIRKERSDLFNKNSIRLFLYSSISKFAFIALFAWSIHSVVSGNITVGILAMYINLASTAGTQFSFLIFYIPYNINLLLPNAYGYKEFIKNAKFVNDEGTEKPPRFSDIEFCNVSFKYPGNDEYVLNNISFKIKGGEKIALIGTNGAGKSTIIKLLLRFYDPQSGSILIDGKDIKLYTLDDLRNLFGVCFQDINKYSLTLRENIAISNIKLSDDITAVTAAAEASGIDIIYKLIEGGIDANLTRNFDDEGYEPSGGQWQKIAISRAFFRDADIIILDEPSSALDPEAEEYIFSSFKRLCINKGGILISHRLSIISIVDKVILIDKGAVIESGTHNELMEANGMYAKLYQMQADNYKE